jgi:lipopolysaccharide biosynthesis regulator YciM
MGYTTKEHSQHARDLATAHAVRAAELLERAEQVLPALATPFATQATAHATLAAFYQREADRQP